MNEIVTHIERLREVALDQHGYVSSAQAAEAGVSTASLAMLERRGRIEHAARGVWRVPQVPATENDRYQLALLWTGRPEAALACETALETYGVCDVYPDSVHVVVPMGRKMRREVPDGYVVHRADLGVCAVGWWDGMRRVGLAAAIRQCAEWGTPTYLLRQALERGLAGRLLGEGERDGLEAMIDVRG